MPINIALTAFDVCMLVTVIGLLACWLAVLPREEGGALETGVLRLLGAAVALLTLSSFGILLSRTLELNGGSFGQLWADLPLALKVTHYGHVWVWRIPALLLLWLAWGWCLRHRHHSWAAWLMVIAVAGIALTRSETGHPADHGDFTFAVWVDWLHLLSGSVWVGSLFGMSLAIFPKLLRRGKTAGEDAAVVFQRLSTLSGIALAVILATGIFTAVGELQSWGALWTSSYGRVLDVKILLVILMIAFGAHNRYAKLPRLLHSVGKPVKETPFTKLFGIFKTNAPSGNVNIMRSSARAVYAESVLGVGVVIAASVLLHGMPPADMRHLPGMQMQMSARSASPVLPEEAGHIPHLSESQHAINLGRAPRTGLREKTPRV
ncbi:MAG: copper resistance D family protein [Gammaproteobacteria bacterium]